MKTIKINEINKVEGHISFSAALDNGDVKTAKITVEEGARLIEGILIGRNYYEAPIITSRICGICPVVHNLTSVKAMENALGLKVSENTVRLRKIMLAAQIIQSHALHLYFCSLPDFFRISDNFKLLKKFPKEGKKAIIIRDFANRVVEVIGGRAIHPINSVVGGFNIMSNIKDIRDLHKEIPQILKSAIELAEFFEKLKYPKFSRETRYISLNDKKGYAFYDGDIHENTRIGGSIVHRFSGGCGAKMRNSQIGSTGLCHNGVAVKTLDFLSLIKEVEIPGNVEKRAEINGKSYMIGAIARVNNNWQKLSPKAKKIFLRNEKNLTSYNNFYNILAQAIEVVHFCEVMEKGLSELYNNTQAELLKTKIKLRAGKGFAICEAPRGLLYHYYELDGNGKIVNCNIAPPTSQFLNNLEDDMKLYLSDLDNANSDRIKFLIRAYDPCISCATH